MQEERGNNSAFSLSSELQEQSDASDLFGLTRVVLQGQAAVRQINELGSCHGTIAVLSRCPS